MRIQDRAVRRALNRDNGLRVSAERLSIKNQIGFDALPYLARIARRALHASALTRAAAAQFALFLLPVALPAAVPVVVPVVVPVAPCAARLFSVPAVAARPVAA